ncbi:MAG: 2-oxo acid dehydrogenase subunit E2, partial [Planctomycetota bacterium]
MIEDVKLPEISENVESGVVTGVLVKVGDFVEKEGPLVELETEKATFEVPSPVAGKVVEISVKEEDEVQVGQVIVKVDTEAEQAPPEPEKATGVETIEEPNAKKQTPPPAAQKEVEAVKAEQEQPPQETKTPPAKAVSAAPAVRQLARELGIDIGRVSGSRPGGRISAEDVKNHAKGLIAGGRPTGGGISKPLPDFTRWGQVERQPMTVTRRKIAETLTYAWSNIPHVTQHDQADITELERFRAEYAQRVEQAGGKLTVTSILLKVVASALKAFPNFNASVDAQSNEIIFKKYYHVGVAVDTDRGLLVPVIRDADKKSILQLSVELTDLAEKARNNKLTPEQMTGGNFTIS